MSRIMCRKNIHKILDKPLKLTFILQHLNLVEGTTGIMIKHYGNHIITIMKLIMLLMTVKMTLHILLQIFSSLIYIKLHYFVIVNY